MTIKLMYVLMNNRCNKPLLISSSEEYLKDRRKILQKRCPKTNFKIIRTPYDNPEE